MASTTSSSKSSKKKSTAPSGPISKIVPGAFMVAVTSGKGGVGKTSTAVALAAALAERGTDVVCIDGDLEGPNVHIVAEMADRDLGVDPDTLTVTVPSTQHGFRVVSPVSVQRANPKARICAKDLIGITQFAAPPQVVIVDLPPGWTSHHETFVQALPDLVLTVAAPTWPSISDHRRHLGKWKKEWQDAVKAHADADKRRKLDLPAEPTIVAIETMARFTGIAEGTSQQVTIRRSDAISPEKVAEHVAPIASIPATSSVAEAAALPEVNELADLVETLLAAEPLPEVAPAAETAPAQPDVEAAALDA